MPVMMEMMVVMMMIVVVVVTEERLLKTHTSRLPISFCCVFLSLIKAIYPIQSGHTTTNNNNVKGVLLSFICMAYNNHGCKEGSKKHMLGMIKKDETKHKIHNFNPGT